MLSFFCRFLEKIAEIFSAFFGKSKRNKNNPLLKEGKMLLIRFIAAEGESLATTTLPGAPIIKRMKKKI
ncbi:hypothetical protein BTI61_08380 [Lactobacillus delbrueckii subsp. bulgaricus]|nr:hypothetical protein [Lactobacillus delbrueckii subsp. bulgaricus]